jgi:hypothetical protein
MSRADWEAQRKARIAKPRRIEVSIESPKVVFTGDRRASDGCVALTNEDLEAIAKSMQIGVTPVIISEGIEWVEPGAVEGLRAEILRQLESWRRDWESRDTARYLAHYASGFTSERMDLAQWSRHEQRVNAQKDWIRVRLDGVSIFQDPGADELVVVTFDQDYASSDFSIRARKRQYWTREEGRWKILYEGPAHVSPGRGIPRTG